MKQLFRPPEWVAQCLQPPKHEAGATHWERGYSLVVVAIHQAGGSCAWVGVPEQTGITPGRRMEAAFCAFHP